MSTDLSGIPVFLIELRARNAEVESTYGVFSTMEKAKAFCWKNIDILHDVPNSYWTIIQEALDHDIFDGRASATAQPRLSFIDKAGRWSKTTQPLNGRLFEDGEWSEEN